MEVSEAHWSGHRDRVDSQLQGTQSGQEPLGWMHGIDDDCDVQLDPALVNMVANSER